MRTVSYAVAKDVAKKSTYKKFGVKILIAGAGH